MPALLIRGPGIRVPSSAPKSHEESKDSSWDFPFSGALHTFCTPAGKPCFSLHCLHSVHRGGTCRGKAPPSCCARPLRRLKAPLGLSLLRCACKREFSILFSGEQQAGELTPLLGVHLSDNFQHPFRGVLDAVRQIFFYRHRAGFGGTDVL